jgi:hypothetical protein
MIIHPISLNQPTGTVLAQTIGPVKGVNWFAAADPIYNVLMTSGVGTIQLQGTSDIVRRLGSYDEYDFLPAWGASWTTIATISANALLQDFGSTGYNFIQIIISTTGTGTIYQAWVKWS